MAQPVTELIPRVRRALEGPAGSVADLSDAQAKAAIADALADVILYSGGLFGHDLLVISRDPDYNAPDDWEIDPALEIHEEGVIVAQAAINHLFYDLRSAKVQETISSEGEEWSYSASANAVAEQLKFLIRMRDEALDTVADQHPVEGFISFVAARDEAAAAIVEPWTNAGLIGQGQ